MDFATALSTLNDELGDGNNFALTATEKTRALTRAWNDPYAVEEALNESLTYDDAEDRYTIPGSAITNVIHIWQKSDSSSDFKQEVPHDAFKIIDGTIQFKDKYRYLLQDSFTLFLHGWFKPTTTDSLSTVKVQEYVLKLAQLNALNILFNKRTFKFLKNDTSVAEIVAQKRELERDVADYRRQMRSIPVQM